MSGTTARYAFRLAIEPEVVEESKIFKQLAFDMVFLSPELKQLEHKGSHLLAELWRVLEARYLQSGSLYGQDFQLLPEIAASEIAAASPPHRGRLICDFLADMTDGYAVRMYKRLFTPDFGSIGDLLG